MNPLLIDAIEEILYTLKEKKYSDAMDELHYAIFDESEKVIDNYDAIQMIAKVGIEKAIKYIIKFELQTYGIVATDFENLVDVANRLWSIIGLGVLKITKTYQKNYLDIVDEKIRKNLIKELEAMLNETNYNHKKN